MLAVVKVFTSVTGTSILLRGYHPLYRMQFFLGPTSVIFFRTEDGINRSLRNIGYFLPDYMAPYARIQ
jgi:hypothetical protein